MSKYNDCILFVDSKGKYCYNADKVVCLNSDECMIVSLLNVEGIDVLVYPTKDTDDASMVVDTLPAGQTTVYGPGVFALDTDCAELAGTFAPEDTAEHQIICCTVIKKSLASAGGAEVNADVLIALEELCAKMLTTNGELSALCAKILAGNVLTASMIAELQALCTKLENDALIQQNILTELQTLCNKLQSLIALQETANNLLQQIIANTAAITGIETSLGQIGCTEDTEGNITGSVLVCKVSDTTTTPPTDTVKVWWFGLDGTVVEDYTGDYVACTNLQALANLLQNILDKTFAKPTIWGVRQDCNTVDNHSIGEPRPIGLGIVALPQHEHIVKIVMSDGSPCEGLWPAQSPKAWADSNAALAAMLASCTGKAFVRASAPPDGDTSTGWGAHAKAVCCPGDKYVVQATAYRSIDGKIIEAGEPGARTIPLAVSYKKGDVVKYKQYDCGPGVADIWTAADGATVEKPDLKCASIDCLFPDSRPACCPEPIDCTVKSFGPLLDCVFSADPDTDPVTVGSGIYVDNETCEGVTTTTIYTLDAEGRPDEYIVQGDLANPDKSLFESEPDCPDVPYEAATIKRKLVILDNSLWDGAPSNHIGAGAFPTTDIEVKWSDGTTDVFNFVAGGSLFTEFRTWVTEQTGCPWYNVVANWPGNDTQLPWGLTDADVPRECLWARGWAFMCCVGGKCIDTATVIASDDPAWVGVSKKACTYDGPNETVYVGHVGCTTVYKDCEGKLIELPPGCCPLPQSTALEDVICPKSETSVGDCSEYTNSDTETDIAISIGVDEMKWQFSADPAEPDALAITEFIRTCVEGSGMVNLSWELVEGGTGSGVITGVTGTFPNYLFSGSGISGETSTGKVQTAKAVCVQENAEGPLVVKTFDACANAKLSEAVDCLKTLKEAFECPEELTEQCFFFTYATNDPDITAISLGGEDISAKFALPIDAQSLPDTFAMIQILEQCLIGEGYSPVVQTGRDGWKITYVGLPVTLTQ